MDNSSLPTTKTRNNDFQFWLIWVIASIAAILLSSGVLFGLIFIVKTISPSINEDRLGGGLMFPILATLLGLSQWLILRKRISKSGWWILATVVGMLSGVYIGGLLVKPINQITGQQGNRDFLPGVLIVYVLIGFLLALLQLPILWRQFRGSVLWLLVSVIGWLVLGLIVDVSIDRSSDIFAFGAIPAIFTGFGLIWLMRTPRFRPNLSA